MVKLHNAINKELEKDAKADCPLEFAYILIENLQWQTKFYKPIHYTKTPFKKYQAALNKALQELEKVINI